MFEDSAFNFDPFEVGNPMTLGFMEELQESTVNDAVEYIRKYIGNELSVESLEEVFADFDIDYKALPHWLAAKFDEFEVY